MLSASSEREKITITIKKSNKELLEKMAESENRNVSRQIDFLIEMYKSQAEMFLFNEMKRAEENLKHPETWLTDEQLTEKLGI